MKNKKIYFLPAWGNTSKQLYDAMILQSPANSGKWKNIQATDSIFEADYFIVQDYTYDELEAFLSINNLWDKVYSFGREVPGGGLIKRYQNIKEFSYLLKNSYLFTKWVYPNQVNGGVSVSYDQLKEMIPPQKDELMICIQSNKRILNGHVLRLKFIEEYCRRLPQDIDIAGGISQEKAFTDLKKPIELIDDNKFMANLNYKYCLAFDNGQYKNYFGTQFTDALLSWCIPVYWGAPNISEFFPEDSYISFDVKNMDEVNRISNIINDPEDYKRRLPALKEARQLILDKYNIWDTMNEAITTGKNTWGKV